MTIAVSNYLTKAETAQYVRTRPRTLDALRAQRRFPEPDARVGRLLLWSTKTLDRFLERGGTPADER